MSWQERLRDLGERLASGEITTNDYRKASEEILAEADAEASSDTQPADTQPAGTQPRSKVHIPVSAAWEAPSGEMTQIVGTEDRTTLVPPPVAERLGGSDEPAP